MLILTRRRLAVVLEIVMPLAVLAAWWTLSAHSTSFYFPPLSDIFTAFRETWLFDRLGSDVVPSLVRLLAGYGIALVIAITVGTALGLSRGARSTAAPIVEFLRAIPPPALLPVGILVFGVGDSMKISVIALVCIWPILLNTIDGIRGIDATLNATVQVYGISGWQRFREVTIPAASPQIFAGMRTSLSLAIIVMVISEMVASTNGLGYFTLQSQRNFAIPEMWAGIILLGFLGYLLNLAFVVIERRALAWHRGARSSALQ
jgi:ABC-type nitrate/sulfonate/bicarbonate transport system permease component